MLKDVHKCIIDFIWIGAKIGMVNVNWDIVCNPKSDGGLQVLDFQMETQGLSPYINMNFFL